MASSANSKKRAGGLAGDEGLGRSSGSKPQLLTQLPGSPFTSPGFIMGIVAVEFLYGLFLFAVMSSNKRSRVEADAKAALYARSVPVEPPLAARIEIPPPQSVPSAESSTRVSDQNQASSTPETAGAQVLVAKQEPPPVPSPKKNPKKRGKKDQKKELALATPDLATPKPALEAVRKPMATLPPLGPLIDPLQDSQVKMTEEAFTIQVAAGAHIFDSARAIADSPRALTEVDGDFTAEVKILGDLQPGTVPLKGLPMTFQGAGLLVWLDKDNYIRFERAAVYTGERLQWLFLESCREGKANHKPMKVREGVVTIRLERRGKAINYSYSLDGKTWLKADHSATSLPSKVSIGISASNASPRPFAARFSDFELKVGR